MTLKQSKSVSVTLLSLVSIFLTPHGCTFCTDICLLQGLLGTFPAGTVYKLENRITKLHALERHGLSSHSRARSTSYNFVLINNIHTWDQLSGMIPKSNVNHTVNFHKAPELCHDIGQKKKSFLYFFGGGTVLCIQGFALASRYTTAWAIPVPQPFVLWLFLW
jgi:hypothetical protein